MGERTEISWCDATWNPWVGCLKVSPGCQHCYAETLAGRFGLGEWGPRGERKRTSDTNWKAPYVWNTRAERKGIRRKVFCASMADLFEDNAQVVEWRSAALSIMEATPWLDWLLLTKRPEHVNVMVPVAWTRGAWPANVWVGTSIESQEWADRRIPWLLGVPTPVRFLSCEPLLGPLDLQMALLSGWHKWAPAINWVIVGGESGGQARPMDIHWARSIRDQCYDAGTPFFFKQVSAPHPTDEMIPEDLRIREFPKVRTLLPPVAPIQQGLSDSSDRG